MTRVEGVVLFVLLLAFSSIVFVGVSGATRIGTSAACHSNATAVTAGIAALRTENSGGFPTTSAGWQQALLSPSEFVGGPFLNSWPRSSDYVITVAGVGAPADSGDAALPRNGDVLVVTAAGRVFDVTLHPRTACATT